MLNIPSEIRNLLKSDSVNKNFRVHFPNGERADITNDNIVDDSITFGESICSSEQLQFGLCETPTLEFETVGVENIKGAVIECSMEVIVPESLSSVTGVTYKSDINKWVYSLPYGTFIVDSCKKQSDMTHRRITTYNTFAYKNFDFNDITKEVFNNSFYWYQSGLKVSIEGLLKLLFPKKNEQFVQISGDHWIELEDSFDKDIEGVHRTYVLYYDSIVYPLPNKYQYKSIYNLKIEYPSEKVDIVKQIETYIKTNKLSFAISVDKISFPSDNLAYHHYNSSSYEYDYILEAPASGPVALTKSRFSIDSSEMRLTFPTLAISTEKYEPGTYKRRSYWINETFADQNAIKLFSRLRLSYYDNYTPEDTVVLFDTGKFTPKLYIDDDIQNVDLFNSDSGIYIPISSKKKSVNMQKSTGGTESKTLYRYDCSSLFSFSSDINMKDLIQSYLELNGKFGLVKRDGNIDFISVNEAFNTPDDTISKSEYESIWYDDYMSKQYGRISASYTNENNENAYTYLDIVEDFSEEKYKTYDVSNNFFIKNFARTEEDIQLMFTAMSLNMKDISFMPMQITMKGRPDLEAGDVILVESNDQEEPIVGFMMQRRLTGVNSLRDEISSQDEISSETVSSLKATYDEDTGTLTLYTADTRR